MQSMSLKQITRILKKIAREHLLVVWWGRGGGGGGEIGRSSGTNLVPRAFPLRNGLGPTHFLREKPWGRGCSGTSQFVFEVHL